MSGSAVTLCTVLCGWDSYVHLQLCGLVPAVEEVHSLLNKVYNYATCDNVYNNYIMYGVRI